MVLEALACGVPALLRDIPVYDGWLSHGRNVYKARSAEDFYQTLSGILDCTLPDLTEAGRAVAEARSLERVGERLQDIYRQASILPAAPALIRN